LDFEAVLFSLLTFGKTFGTQECQNAVSD